VSKKEAFSDLLNRKPVNTIKHKDVNTGIQDDVSAGPIASKKKATYELDLELHTELKIFAAKHNKKMVDVVEEALRQYLKNQQ
jgi:hypothetical protein